MIDVGYFHISGPTADQQAVTGATVGGSMSFRENGLGRFLLGWLQTKPTLPCALKHLLQGKEALAVVVKAEPQPH